MADIITDGKTKVSWVPSIASTSAPTTTELNAGIALQDTATADGMVGFQPDTASIDTTALSSTFDTARGGRAQYSGTMLRFKKQTGTDTIYDTLVRYATGYIVVRRDTAESTAWASSDNVEVYPVECGEVRHMDPEANTLHRYEVPLFLTDAPDLRAQVA